MGEHSRFTAPSAGSGLRLIILDLVQFNPTPEQDVALREFAQAIDDYLAANVGAEVTVCNNSETATLYADLGKIRREVGLVMNDQRPITARQNLVVQGGRIKWRAEASSEATNA